jgi:putative membrane protein
VNLEPWEDEDFGPLLGHVGGLRKGVLGWRDAHFRAQGQALYSLNPRLFLLGIERQSRLRRQKDRATLRSNDWGASMILQSLAGLPAFLVYFCTAVVAVVAYLFVYTRITPHDEFQLIRDNDPAAAIALGLSLLGFVLPVVSAIAHSANVWDCLIWSAVALVVQIAVYFMVKIPIPNLSARIAAGELAAAIWLGLASLAAGALNAASMIY